MATRKQIEARFERLPGKARNYVDKKTGKVFSRRQYDKHVNELLAKGEVKTKERSTGKKSAEREARELRSRRDYERHVQQRVKYEQRHNIKGENGKRRSVRDIRNSDEMKQAIKDLKSKSSKKQLAALKYLGLRENIPDHVPIGETNVWLASVGGTAAWR